MRLLKLWLPVAAWAGIIFFFSSVPDLKTGLKYDLFLRKIAHVTEYFILAFFLYRALSGSFKMDPRRLFISAAVFTLLYAASDEIHQFFVEGRNCSLGDFLIDSLGVVCLYATIKLKQRRQRC